MKIEHSIFDYRSQKIRMIEIEGEPWFVAKDVCRILEINHIAGACRKLDKEEKNTVFLNDHARGNPTNTIVSESGLYSLILSSRKAEARAFKKWVTSEVLPALRKKGSFSLKPAGELDLIIATATAMKQVRAQVETHDRETE